MAKSSTSFKEGNPGGGRKGYEYEEKQLKRMKKLLNGILALGEKIQSGKAKPEHLKRFELLLKLNLKIMDKLHANKQHIDWPDDKKLPFNIIIEKSDGRRREEGEKS